MQEIELKSSESCIASEAKLKYLCKLLSDPKNQSKRIKAFLASQDPSQTSGQIVLENFESLKSLMKNQRPIKRK